MVKMRKEAITFEIFNKILNMYYIKFNLNPF